MKGHHHRFFAVAIGGLRWGRESWRWAGERGHLPSRPRGPISRRLPSARGPQASILADGPTEQLASKRPRLRRDLRPARGAQQGRGLVSRREGPHQLEAGPPADVAASVADPRHGPW